jgi:hypothetical protein
MDWFSGCQVQRKHRDNAITIAPNVKRVLTLICLRRKNINTPDIHWLPQNVTDNYIW